MATRVDMKDFTEPSEADATRSNTNAGKDTELNTGCGVTRESAATSKPHVELNTPPSRRRPAEPDDSQDFLPETPNPPSKKLRRLQGATSLEESEVLDK